MPFHARIIANGLKLSGDAFKQSYSFFSKIYKTFVDLDASLVEINPLVLSKENKLIALDAKMSFDNNSLFRQSEVLELKDETEEEPSETLAKKFDLAYIKLDGEIGCLVNGAGLAMATMDIINLKGSSPANFLDVGGSATKEKVKEAFKIILSDDAVKGILVNIFGGIMRCDIIAEGVVAAASDLALDKPLVVRLSGTNVEKGKEILSKSDLQIISADDLDDAAEKIVNAVNNERKVTWILGTLMDWVNKQYSRTSNNRINNQFWTSTESCEYYSCKKPWLACCDSWDNFIFCSFSGKEMGSYVGTSFTFNGNCWNDSIFNC